ncbi:MAG TPA: NAD(P)-dependent alcohol dehydrogenase [Casimicrobiaceae bacterium]|nr:NAD(P)-dependent alcohol dehydrogenase [Casimicrobiaceae bacterium]
MRALRFHRYGPPEVLAIEDIAEPVPRPGEAKVRVLAAGLNPLDAKIRAGHLRWMPLFLPPPRGVGCDFCGEIVGVGGGGTERHVGERVFGSLTSFGRQGALAEFITVAFQRLLPLPPSLDAELAAALPIAGATALQGLVDHAQMVAGQRVLITGAAGGVGHFAVQIAKHLGVYVVGVCSASNAEFARSLGADEVVDYARSDFSARADRFDVVFDAAGASTFASARRILTDQGIYLNTGGDAAAVVTTAASAVLAQLTSRQRAIVLAVRNRADMWQRVLQLVLQGAVRPHVERTIALEDVADAQRQLETGHGRGKIVARID